MMITFIILLNYLTIINKAESHQNSMNNKYLSASSCLFFVDPSWFFMTLFDQNKVGKKEISWDVCACSALQKTIFDMIHKQTCKHSQLKTCDDPRLNQSAVSTADLKTWSCCDSSNLNSVWGQSSSCSSWYTEKNTNNSESEQ